MRDWPILLALAPYALGLLVCGALCAWEWLRHGRGPERASYSSATITIWPSR